MVRTYKERTNKGQIPFYRKIYWGLIRDKYLGKKFNQINTVPTHKKHFSHNKHTFFWPHKNVLIISEHSIWNIKNKRKTKKFLCKAYCLPKKLSRS